MEVSRRNLQKYIAAQEAGSNRASSVPRAHGSALSSSDFTAFSGWRPLFRSAARRIKKKQINVPPAGEATAGSIVDPEICARRRDAAYREYISSRASSNAR